MNEQAGAVVPLTQQTAVVAMVDMGGAQMPLAQAIEIATQMEGAATLPRHFQKRADLVAAVLSAMQWRVPIMAVVRGCHMIEGKLTPGADLMVAIARASGDILDWHEEPFDEPVIGCRVTAAVRGLSHPVTETFTLADAQRAGLAGKDNWRKWPRDMCRARAVSRVAARACPAALAGIYSQEEMSAAAPAAYLADASEPRRVDTATGEVLEAEFADSDPAVVVALVAAYDAATTRAEIDEADAAATAAKDDGTVPRGSAGIRTVAKARREALAALAEAELDDQAAAAAERDGDGDGDTFDPANAEPVDTLEAE